MSETQTPNQTQIIDVTDNEELVDKLFEEKMQPVLKIILEDEEREGLTRREVWEETAFYVIEYGGEYYILLVSNAGHQLWYDNTLLMHRETGDEYWEAYLVKGDVKEALKKLAEKIWRIYDDAMKRGKYKRVKPSSLEELMKEI